MLTVRRAAAAASAAKITGNACRDALQPTIGLTACPIRLTQRIGSEAPSPGAGLVSCVRLFGRSSFKERYLALEPGKLLVGRGPCRIDGGLSEIDDLRYNGGVLLLPPEEHDIFSNWGVAILLLCL